MKYKVITPVATEPVTLAQARLQVRLTDDDGTDEDTLLTAYITAAREIAEHYTGRALAPQTLEAALQRFRGNATVCSWFPEGFADVYVKHKEGEIAHLAGKTQAEICAAYESAY